MTKITLPISRRGFVVSSAAAGAGFSLGFPTGVLADGHEHPPEVNAWVVVRPDDTVVIRIARSEMGQGTLTGLAQLVAEELDCDWSKVTTEYPTPATNLQRDRVWGSFSTGGSRGIRGSVSYVREGGAAAKAMLIQAAANEWNVDASDCSSKDSIITHGPTGWTVTYGAVAEAAGKLPVPESVTVKDPEDWELVGTSVMRLDTEDKLTGKQLYGADLQMDGMLTATVKKCPVFGGTLASYDDSDVINMPGVKAVMPLDGDTVAVVADTWWQAKTAMDALPIEWDVGEHGTVTSASLDEFLIEGLGADEAFIGNENGDVEAGLAEATQVIEADYRVPFQNHATMEPQNATAVWTDDRCDVWCPVQGAEGALAAVAEAAELPIEQCDVHKLLLGGGFGRRGSGADYCRQAVLLAKAMPGTPIKVLWTREEDMAQGQYHPLTMARLRGGLDEDGNLSGLHFRISGQSILAGVAPQALRNGMDFLQFQGLMTEGEHAISYSIPNLRIDHAMRNPHLPPGFWRGVNVNQNAIYMECFLDEMAHAAGKDALDFRRALMAEHPKNLAVLEAAAEQAGWGAPLPEGRGRGLAVCKAFDAYIAACAEVSVIDGELKIHKIVAATDPGYVVNPQQVEAQVQGSFVYGLSALLYGEVTVDEGRVVELNFDTYPSMTIADMPEVEVIIMPSGGWWGGVGEPTIAVAAPAVLNAIFDATGQRIRQFPLSKQELRSA